MKIAVTGGKGGTGKSTVATALAVGLAKNSKVLFVDADVDCPNDHLLLGIERKKARKVEQRIPKWDFEKCTKCGQCGPVCKVNAIVSIKDKNPIFMQPQCNGCGSCVIKCPVDAINWSSKEIGYVYQGSKAGVHLISGELRVSEPISEFVVKAAKSYASALEGAYSHTIIDTAAGTHCDVISALEGCDLALAVTEPTPLGTHDLELILELLKILKIKSRIVINRSDIGDKGLVENIARKYGVDIITEIPYSREIIESNSKGKPIDNKFITKFIDGISKWKK